MQVAASFIEYLITGCLTLIWLLPPICETGICSSETIAKQVFLLIPAAYVLGMVVDFVSKGVVKFILKLKEALWKLFGLENTPDEYKHCTAFVVLHSADLGKEYQFRSSRDRIARGAFLNSLIFFALTISGLYTLPVAVVNKFGSVWINAALLLLVLLSFGMWWRFETLSRRFRGHSVIAIREKQDKEAKK